MRLYGHPMSSCTRMVLTTLAEKNHDAELVVVELMKGEQKSEAHVARHPFGVVPVLEDGAFSMYEARAIVRYLDAKLPGPSLTPSKLEERARMEQWVSVEQSYFSPHSVKIVKELIHKRIRGQEPARDVIEAARTELAHTTEVLDQALARQEFLAGATFSIADIVFMPYVAALFACEQGDVITSRPSLTAWWNRTSGRPSWLKTLSLRDPNPPPWASPSR